MRLYKELDTGKIIPEYDLYATWADQDDDEADIEPPFDEWLFLNQWQNGGDLTLIGYTTDLSKKIYAEYYCTDTDEIMSVMELYKYYLTGNSVAESFSRYLNWCDCLIPIMFED